MVLFTTKYNIHLAFMEMSGAIIISATNFLLNNIATNGESSILKTKK